MDPDGQFNPPAQGQSDPLPTDGSQPASSGVLIPPNDPISASSVPLGSDPLTAQELQSPIQPAVNPTEPMTSFQSSSDPALTTDPPPNPAPTSTTEPNLASPQPQDNPAVVTPAFDRPIAADPPADPQVAVNPDPPAQESTNPTVQAGGGKKVWFLAAIAFLLAIVTVVLYFLTRGS